MLKPTLETQCRAGSVANGGLARPSWLDRRESHSPVDRSPAAAPGRWLIRAGYLAAIWSALYGMLGLYWTLGGSGFPFGAEHDPDPAISKGLSILGGVQQESAAPVIALLGLVGSIVALAMVTGRARGRVVPLLLAFAWTAALVLTVMIPDSRPMIAAGHVPILVAGKPFGWPPGVSISSQLPWPVLNQGVLMLGGFLFGATAVGHGRRLRGACLACGRGGTGRDILGAGGAARIGAWATWTAVILPLLYAITRWAYALGIPLGVSSEFLEEMERENPGIWLGGAFLGLLALGGSILTVGLVASWGEVFPRWMPFVGGKRVPIPLATVPAMLVAAIATSAGLMLVRLQLRDPGFGSWTLTGPGLLWPVWGAALFVAALAYHYRRRPPCQHCGRS